MLLAGLLAGCEPPDRMVARAVAPAAPAARTDAEPPLPVQQLDLPADDLGQVRQLVWVVVDPTRWQVEVVAARRRQDWQTAAAVAQQHAAAAVLNGGYFDPRDRPMGWLVAGGRQLNPPRRNDWPVLTVQGNRVRIRAADGAATWRGVRQAVQCGPRLVVDGHPTQLKDSPRRARSAAGLDSRHHLVLAATRQGGLTLAELAAALARPVAAGGPGCQVAMNLDGGPSTQFCVPGQVDVPGLYPMPSHLVILPRSRP